MKNNADFYTVPSLTRAEIVALLTSRAFDLAAYSRTKTFILLDVVRGVWPDASETDRNYWSVVLKDAGVIRHSAYSAAFEISPEVIQSILG